MSTSLTRVVRAVEATPWAMQREKLEEICGFLEAAAAGNRLTAAEAREIFAASPRSPSRSGKVAVLPLYGTISQRMGMLSAMSGGTSTEAFGQAFDAAVNDPEVTAIVIDCDSPGGTVPGVAELHGKIMAARGSKPIIAQVNSLCASAAYWICSACDEVVSSVSGQTGSVGVFMVHTDVSEAAAKQGVKHTIIRAGEHKAEGNPYEPLSDEAREFLQDEVDDVYGMFVADVAKGRGVSPADVRANFGGGRVLRAKAAKKAGMIDRIATLDQTLARLGVRTAVGGSLRAVDDALPMAATAFTEGTWRSVGLGGVPDTVLTTTATAAVESGHLVFRWSESIDEEPNAGGAATAHADPPATEPAPEAREEPMSDQDKAAPVVGPTAEQIRNVVAMAREAGMPDREATDLALTAGVTEENAGNHILQWQRANQSAGAVRVGATREHNVPFTNLGEQLQAVVAASSPINVPGLDRATALGRLEMHAAASGHSATVGADGGFLVGRQREDGLMKRAYDESVLARRCSMTPIGENADGLEAFSIKESSRADGSRYGGVRFYRTAEAAEMTASQLGLETFEIRLSDLTAVTYVTDRLLQDAPALESEVSEAFGREGAFVLDDEIYRGSGVGKCLGAVADQNQARVSVAKETGQLADTLVAENVQKIWARVWSRSRFNGIWVYNQELEPQLQSMQIGTGTSGHMVYMPPGGLSGAQFGSLFGRPAIPIEQASAPGDVGDIAFLDLSQYKLIQKGGITADQSMHVRFLYNERAFRFIWRVNGRPRWSTALTPYKGSDTLSPFVTLAERA